MLRKLITPFILGSTIALCGCTKSILDNEARCPFVDKGGCQSMEMVNQMVTERRFTPDGAFVQHFSEPATNKHSSNKRVQGDHTKRVARMWVSPWTGRDGKVHQGSYEQFALKEITDREIG